MSYLQGDVFWLDLREPVGSEPGYRHPCIIVQNDEFNLSKISTVVVCMCTSNLVLENAPGNVRLYKGDASLPEPCVANISQIITINKSDLREKIGRLSNGQLAKVIEGITFLLNKTAGPYR